MPSEQDRSEFVEPLPARPNLEMQHKRAKALLRAAWAGNAHALKRIRALHPKAPAADLLKLADAQLVVARGYGFESWAAMKSKVEPAAMISTRCYVRIWRRLDASTNESRHAATHIGAPWLFVQQHQRQGCAWTRAERFCND